MRTKRILIGLLLALFFGATIILLLSSDLDRHSDAQALSPKAHRYIALYSGDNQAFKADLRKGLETAAESADAYVTFRAFSSRSLESHIAGFEEAIAANVDGIITNVPSNGEIGRLIDRAALEKIPVVTIVDDIYGSQRKAYIGVDYESFGSMASHVMQTCVKGNARAAVISYPLSLQTRECTQKVSGFVDSISKSDRFRLGIEHVDTLDYLSAYNLAQNLLDASFGYNAFFCIDETLTLAVAQCIADNHCAERTYLVGCGEAVAVYGFLEDGAIDAILTENPYYVGYEAVTSLTRYIENGGLPYITDAKICVVTPDNMQDSFYEDIE
ncbi:MAG: substrate-binding domain-containing protein [Clostridia bacterium]